MPRTPCGPSRTFGFLTKRNSGSIAKNRLQFLLVSDRAGCTPEVMEMIRDDMIKAISKYMEIDAAGTEIRITQAGERNAPDRFPVLCASIPIRVLLTKGNYL